MSIAKTTTQKKSAKMTTMTTTTTTMTTRVNINTFAIVRSWGYFGALHILVELHNGLVRVHCIAISPAAAVTTRGPVDLRVWSVCEDLRGALKP